KIGKSNPEFTTQALCQGVSQWTAHVLAAITSLRGYAFPDAGVEFNGNQLLCQFARLAWCTRANTIFPVSMRVSSLLSACRTLIARWNQPTRAESPIGVMPVCSPTAIHLETRIPMSHARKVAARFAAYTWYEEVRSGRHSREEAARFAREDWKAFLPV